MREAERQRLEARAIRLHTALHSTAIVLLCALPITLPYIHYITR